MILATAVLGILTAAGGPSSAATASSSSSSSDQRPKVVQRVVVTVPGLHGSTPGPRSITVRFHHPTRRGDLLVAGVDDGVQTSGMVHARYLFPRWRRAVSTVGGLRASTGRQATGGLQAAIYFYDDNPGGIVSVPVATIPAASLDWVSVVLVELAGAPPARRVDTTGTATDGPWGEDFSVVSTVRTRHRTASAGELVMAVFNNGDNSPHGVRFLNSPGWTRLGVVHDPNNNEQPIFVDYRIQRARAVASETDHYVGGSPTDNCAVIAALR